MGGRIRCGAGLALLDRGRRAVLDALLPPLCLLCGAPGTGQRDLCAGCAADLPLPEPACPVCAESVAVADTACGRCQRRPPPFARTLAALRYAAPADQLIIDLKFHARLPAARLLGALLTDAVRGAERPEALIPVPLHPSRLRERGFNQALELARPVARALELPLLVDVVRRQRATPPQTGIDHAARRRNVRDAFVVYRPLPMTHVALVDDVMTTGSTVLELARVLRQGGIPRVQVWVAARARVR